MMMMIMPIVILMMLYPYSSRRRGLLRPLWRYAHRPSVFVLRGLARPSVAVVLPVFLWVVLRGVARLRGSWQNEDTPKVSIIACIYFRIKKCIYYGLTRKSMYLHMG